MRERLEAANIQIFTGEQVHQITPEPPPGLNRVTTRNGASIQAPFVFDATYGQLANQSTGALQELPFKYEQAEIVLVEPPSALDGLAVTVMDGPFFSIMPFPAQDCYSLTHVRYTPHRAWTQADCPVAPAPPETSHRLHMQRDAQRFMPVLAELKPRGSLYETKTILLKNESDDGRPIFLHQNAVNPGYRTVLGGKIDNIYDLFEALIESGGPFASASAEMVTGKVT